MLGDKLNGIETEKSVYIVISQTGTILSRLLKAYTGKEYNHVSISLSDDLDVMYSFGRKTAYFPFWGGFVAESINFGTFKRFGNAKVIVLKLDVDKPKYEAVSEFIRYMERNSKKYGYNYLGVIMAAFHISHSSRFRYYCSEFVKDVLIRCGIDGADKLDRIIHPMNFLEIPYIETVFCGRLADYDSKYTLLA